MKNYIESIRESIVRNWDSAALTDMKGTTFTYGMVANEMETLSLMFEAVGISAGDKVAICAHNSSRWGIAFLAIQKKHAVAVPLLDDFAPEIIMNLVNHSDSTILFTDEDIWSKLNHESMPGLKAVIRLSDFSPISCSGSIVIDMDSITGRKPVTADKFAVPLQEQSSAATEDSLDYPAIISYTSGTTGTPKGVIISNKNLSSNMEFGLNAVTASPGSNLVSMLPLAHLYGLMWELLFQLASGCHVHFLGKTPAPKILFNAFAQVKPYMVITVPLVVEKIFKNAVFPSIDKPSVKAIMAIPFGKRAVYRSIRKKLMTAFGGNLEFMFIGGAAINETVEEWLQKLEFPYSVGYGMTECAPLLGYSDWHTYIPGSCGRIVTGMEIRIDSNDPLKDAGEIQVRGNNVMMGYYKNPEATSKAFTPDGWMKTGDMGLLDGAGNIYIKGRCKNMILGADGQNIYPEEIEDLLNNLPFVSESLVVKRGSRLIALVYPDYAMAKQSQLNESALISKMEENRTSINSKLPPYSRISKIEIMKNEFEKTPKKSIKRFLYE